MGHSIHEWEAEVRQKIIEAALDLSADIDKYRIIHLLAIDDMGKAFSVTAQRDDSGPLESIGLLKTMLNIQEEEMLAGYRQSERPFAEDDKEEE